MKEAQVGSEFDDALAQYLIRSRMALKEQIQDARDSQSMAAEHGLALPLGEALVKLGTITATQRETVERLLKEEHFTEKRLGNYKLLKRIGAGTMGSVFLAEDTLGQRKVALKVLSKKLAGMQEFLERFKHEAQATGRLNHLNVVSAFDVGQAQGRYYYVMEYCDGESLEGILKREQFLLPEMALDIILQTAQGLDHAHEHGIIHRDIKPGNVLLTNEGVAKILDMGLSKTISDAEASFNTQNGLAVGTPHYMSPEQVRGDKDVDGRADIYSLGATLYQLVTGQTPYKGTTPNIVMTMHISEKLTNPQDIRPELPDNVVHLIERMMAKNVKDRYQDCKELIADLRRVIDGKDISEPLREEGADDSDEHESPVEPRRHNNSSLKLPPVGRSTTSRHDQHSVNASVRRKVKKPRPAVLGLSLLVGALFIWVVWLLFYRDNEAPPAVDPYAPKVQPAPGPVSPPSNPALSTPVNPQSLTPASTRRMDLLPLIDAKKDAVAGNWQIKNRELLSDGAGYARIEIPFTPPDEYDFQITFTRQSGKNDVNQILTHNGRSFMWMMNGMDNNSWALDTVGGARAGINATTVKLPPIENGRKYTSLIQVRKNYVAAYLDGKPVGAWSTNYQDLQIMADWKLRNINLLGVGTYMSPTIFHSIEINPVGK